jgi:hypothetical protein
LKSSALKVGSCDYKTVHTGSLGQGQGKGGNRRTCSVITLPDANIRIYSSRPRSICNTILLAEIAVDWPTFVCCNRFWFCGREPPIVVTPIFTR